MAYCVLEDLLNRVGEETLVQLTDDAGSGDVGTEVVEAAIADADAEIDGAVGLAWKVPMDPVPALIRRLSVDLAIHGLHARRVDAVPETWRKAHERALALLDRIAEGKIAFGERDPGGNPPEKAGVAHVAAPQVMAPGKLERF